MLAVDLGGVTAVDRVGASQILRTATVTTAVNKSPAYARLSTIATAGDLFKALTTRRDTTRPR